VPTPSTFLVLRARFIFSSELELESLDELEEPEPELELDEPDELELEELDELDFDFFTFFFWVGARFLAGTFFFFSLSLDDEVPDELDDDELEDFLDFG